MTTPATVTTLPSPLETIGCPSCGLPFAVPERWLQSRRESHADFHCPNGCSLRFPTKTRADVLREDIADRDARIAQLEATLKKYESAAVRALRRSRRWGWMQAARWRRR